MGYAGPSSGSKLTVRKAQGPSGRGKDREANARKERLQAADQAKQGVRAQVQRTHAFLEWMDLKGHNVMEVLKWLNPIVRGWANYFRIGVSKCTFEALDYWMLDRGARYVRSN
jgi:hypothetical protein